jgi:2,4-dienoyl-CoA reductase-like NADH-dependent reductase (Old Yellow Enzyme family)
MTPATLDASLPLPCGAQLKNRLLKAAMSEQLGDETHHPTPGLGRLFARLAKGGVGTSLTGNVMIDRLALGEPKNVVLDAHSRLDTFERWAERAREHGTHAWMQLNHPGKQSPGSLSPEPVAPSAVPLTGRLARFFNRPRALSAEEIRGLIERFALAAGRAQEAGFTGVQLHGAHGYLVSQFLSPLHNVRTDEWGGTPENRRRFALEVYRAVRAKVGSRFPVSFKLNSADFQKGGLEEGEAMETVALLSKEGVDLIEISGGNYEAPAMTGARSKAREAYFLDFAARARVHATVPLAVTGGFRTGAVMAEALATGATDVIGLARPLAVDPDFARRLLASPSASVTLRTPSTGLKAVDRASMLDITYYEVQLQRMAKGQEPDPSLSAWRAVWMTAKELGLSAFRPRRA